MCQPSSVQIRANPVMNYLRDLVADGYVGEVLSTTVIGSAERLVGVQRPEPPLFA